MKTVLPQKYIHERIIGVDVPHAHVHLIPFNESSELLNEQDLNSEPDFSALQQMAEKLAVRN